MSDGSRSTVDQLIHVISHDFRAPLRGIRNIADWIAEDLGDKIDKELEDYLRLLAERVDRLDAMLDSLLLHSRIGRIGDGRVEVDAGPLVRDVAAELAIEDQCQLVIGDLPRIQGERWELLELFRQLLANAVTHGRPTEISVSAEDAGHFWLFEITDDGPGIPDADRQRVLELFERGRDISVEQCLGMGLAICDKIVANAGGQLDIKDYDEGTRVAFTWPKNGASQ